MADPEAMSEAQAAAALRVHPKTMARWRRARLVTCQVTPTGRVRYRWDDIVRLRTTMQRPADAPICPHMSGEPEDAGR